MNTTTTATVVYNTTSEYFTTEYISDGILAFSIVNLILLLGLCIMICVVMCGVCGVGCCVTSLLTESKNYEKGKERLAEASAVEKLKVKVQALRNGDRAEYLNDNEFNNNITDDENL